MPTEEEYKAKLDKLQKLLKGKGQHLAEKYCATAHKNLSHYPKEAQEDLLRVAKMALMDRIIMYLTKIQ